MARSVNMVQITALVPPDWRKTQFAVQVGQLIYTAQPPLTVTAIQHDDYSRMTFIYAAYPPLYQPVQSITVRPGWDMQILGATIRVVDVVASFG